MVRMPRVSVARPPARPSTDEQHARQERMLRAAARLGSRLPLERVQMATVATDAGVASGRSTATTRPNTTSSPRS